MLVLAYVLDGRLQAGINFFEPLQKKYPRNSGVLSALSSLYRQAGENGLAIQTLSRLVYGSDAGPMQREYAETMLSKWVSE